MLKLTLHPPPKHEPYLILSQHSPYCFNQNTLFLKNMFAHLFQSDLLKGRQQQGQSKYWSSLACLANPNAIFRHLVFWDQALPHTAENVSNCFRREMQTADRSGTVIKLTWGTIVKVVSDIHATELKHGETLGITKAVKSQAFQACRTKSSDISDTSQALKPKFLNSVRGEQESSTPQG